MAITLKSRVLQQQPFTLVLTAQNWGRRCLKSQSGAVFASDVNAEHQPSSCAFFLGASNPYPSFNVSVPQLQYSHAINPTNTRWERVQLTSVSSASLINFKLVTGATESELLNYCNTLRLFPLVYMKSLYDLSHSRACFSIQPSII